MKKTILLLVLLCLSIIMQAQHNDPVYAYIEQYKELAIAEQHRSRIPAAIKLAQGILESGAGNSELAINAQNHFGIKCKNTWTGDTYTKDDDAKDECFRKYNSSHQSFIDHSDFLNVNKRYAQLFNNEITDYKAWARGLKKAGYATNPQYADKLISVIERYNLNQFTHEAVARLSMPAAPVAIAASVESVNNYNLPESSVTASRAVVNTSAMETQDTSTKPVAYYNVMTLNGKKGFYARKDDMLLQHAIQHKIRYAKILEYNDLEDAPLPYDMFIYLESKSQYGSTPYVTKDAGKSMHLISQEQGITMQSLLAMNYLLRGEEAADGARLYLQNKAAQKPPIADKSSNVQSTTIASTTAPNQNNYISKQEIESTNIPEKTASVQVHTPAVANENNQAVSGPVATTSTTPVQESKPTSELDNLVQQLDKSVYGAGSANSRSQQKPNIIQPGKTSEEPNTNANTSGVVVTHEDVKIMPSNKANDQYFQTASNEYQVKGNPAESLKQHMTKVKQGKVPTYVPKAMGIEHTSAPSPPAPKKTAAKKTTSKNAKGKVAANTKKTTTKKTNSTSTKKTTAAKKSTAAKKTTTTKKKK